MRRSERLGHLRDEFVAQRKRLDERVAAAQLRAQEAAQRLAELRRYRDEYASGFEGRAAAGIGGAGLRDYQAFLARLDEAVRQQQQIWMRAEAELEFERQRWRDAAVQVRAVEAVGERWRADENREAARREQGESDEHANSISYRSRSD
jgi:flagellar FliJ protein